MVEPAVMVEQTASEDPEVGLRGVASLRALLEAVEELQVRRARGLGGSGQQIAELLGVPKRGVHKKYARGGRGPRGRLGWGCPSAAVAGRARRRSGRPSRICSRARMKRGVSA